MQYVHKWLNFQKIKRGKELKWAPLLTNKNSMPFLIGGLFSSWNQHMRDLEFSCGPWIVIYEKSEKS